MAQNKTQKTNASVDDYLNGITEKQQPSCREICGMMTEITGEQPAMWGDSLVGFGSYHYTYASGHGGEWFLTGFSARKQNITLYIMPGFSQYDDLLAKLGKHKLGRSCLYINSLEQIDVSVLAELITLSVDFMKNKYK